MVIPLAAYLIGKPLSALIVRVSSVPSSTVVASGPLRG
jgi:hypothetical protein